MYTLHVLYCFFEDRRVKRGPWDRIDPPNLASCIVLQSLETAEMVEHDFWSLHCFAQENIVL